jgi:hypothetical protein
MAPSHREILDEEGKGMCEIGLETRREGLCGYLRQRVRKWVLKARGKKSGCLLEGRQRSSQAVRAKMRKKRKEKA